MAVRTTLSRDLDSDSRISIFRADAVGAVIVKDVDSITSADKACDSFPILD